MEDATTTKVYVRFVDGTNVAILINAQVVSDGVYQLLQDDEFDYDDNSILFEFGPGDTVGVKSFYSDSMPLAHKLIKAGEAHYLPQCLQFHILDKEPDPYEFLKDISKDDIVALLDKIDTAFFVYPTVREWVARHREVIQNLALTV